MKSAKPTVLEIFFYDGHLGVAPTLLGLSQLWIENGGEVHIYTRPSPRPFPEPETHHPNMHVHRLSSAPGRWIDQKLHRKHPFRVFRSFLSLLSLLVFALQCLMRSSRMPATAADRVAIGVDLFGILTRHLVGGFIKGRPQFLSLELPPYTYTPLPGWAQGPARRLARDAYHASESILVQSDERLEVVERYMGRAKGRVFYLPNAPLDRAAETPEAPNFFRTQLKLDPIRFPFIALNAGLINEQIGAATLASAFAPLSKDWALVYHDRAERSENCALYRKLRQANPTNLFLSTRPVSYRDIDRIYSAATVGLVFYDNPGGENDDWNSIAMASGKLAHLLQHGKPVLAGPMPSLIRLIDQHDCGIIIREMGCTREIEAALETIMRNYDRYSANARRCFEECFEFRKCSGPFFSFLDTDGGHS